jgi:hypothetical protein
MEIEVTMSTVGDRLARTGQFLRASSRARSAAGFSISPEISKRRVMRRKRSGGTSSCSEVTETARWRSSWRFFRRTTTTS